MNDLVFVLSAPFALFGLAWLFGKTLIIAAAVFPHQPCITGSGSRSIDPAFMDKMIRLGLKVGVVFGIVVTPFAFLLL